MLDEYISIRYVEYNNYFIYIVQSINSYSSAPFYIWVWNIVLNIQDFF